MAEPKKPRKRVTKPAPKPAPGRMLKVLTTGPDGEQQGEWSKQLPVDPFKYRHTGLIEPPYSPEQLVFLAEQHATHAAALEQKAADVVGAGWNWSYTGDEEEELESGNEEEKARLEQWFDELADDTDTDQTTHEILLAAWNDVETIGHGVIELARDTQGRLVHWFHVPAHTTRFHRDGVRICQVRDEKKRWFKRWIPGDSRKVDMITGRIYGQSPADEDKEQEDASTSKDDGPKVEGNEMLVLKRPSRRSSYYGIPTYMPATGWITLSTAARDDNVMFFSNRREPRWAIVLENVDDDPALEEQLREALQVDLEKPHKNLLIPLSGPAKLHFQQLGDNKGDMSFEKLQMRADDVILTAHRMPGERIGIVRSGALGGNAVVDAVRVYKEAVVQTSQLILAARINKLIRAEDEFSGTKYKWAPTELDLTEEKADQDQAVASFQGGLATLDDARVAYGLDPLNDPTKEEEAEGEVEQDPRGDKFFWELAPQAAAAAQMLGMLGGGGGGFGAPAGDQGALDQANTQLADEIQTQLDDLDEGVTKATERLDDVEKKSK